MLGHRLVGVSDWYKAAIICVKTLSRGNSPGLRNWILGQIDEIIRNSDIPIHRNDAVR